MVVKRRLVHIKQYQYHSCIPTRLVAGWKDWTRSWLMRRAMRPFCFWGHGYWLHCFREHVLFGHPPSAFLKKLDAASFGEHWSFDHLNHNANDAICAFECDIWKSWDPLISRLRFALIYTCDPVLLMCLHSGTTGVIFSSLSLYIDMYTILTVRVYNTY